MLENSYIGQGFKYGIVFSPFMADEIEKMFNSSYKDQARMVKGFALCPNSGIIPFEDIDGIPIRELMEMIDNKSLDSTLVFVMYSGFRKESGSMTYGDFFPIFIQFNEEDSDTQVDDVVVNYMLENYSGDESEYNKRVKGFLQKYKFGSKTRTDEKIIEYKK